MLGSVVVKLDPTTANVDWSAVAPLETERGAVYDRVIVLPGGPLSLAGSISQLDAKGDVLWSIPRSTDHFSEYGGAAAGVPNTGWIQSAQFTGTWTSGANFDIRLLSSASGEPP